jgi:hypothetical protein
LLTSCSTISFGDIRLSAEEKEFCRELNDEIISLCESLPDSMQTDALLFIMNYLKTFINEDLNFFRYFYAPAWSIIYWLIQSGPNENGLAQIDIKHAKTAHSMAMFLHPLDDHLIDNELPVNHLTLLLRSQAWMIMDNAFNSLANGVDGGQRIFQGFIDDYFSSICGSEEIDSLDRYCDIFRKQMATWLIVPMLMIKKMSTNKDYINAIMTAYGSFGIAWRLLDDINDIQTDMINGAHSSVYVCLSDDVKECWGKNTSDKTDENGEHTMVVLNYILENHVIEIIKERICIELALAASLADDTSMPYLADEYRCLLRPLKSKQNDVQR